MFIYWEVILFEKCETYKQLKGNVLATQIEHILPTWSK